MGGKVTLLGFYGLAPYVEILLVNREQPLPVAFVAGLPAVPLHDHPIKIHNHVFVISDPNGKVLIETPPVPLNIEPGRRGQVAMGYIMPPTVNGKHTVKILVDNEVKLETYFYVRIATAAELAKAGIPLPH